MDSEADGRGILLDERPNKRVPRPLLFGHKILRIALSLLTVFALQAILAGHGFAQGASEEREKALLRDGIVAYQSGRYQEAASNLGQVRAMDPSNSPAALYLGLAFLKQGKTAEAISAWQAYTKLQPSTQGEWRRNAKAVVAQNLAVLIREENHRLARAGAARERGIAGTRGIVAAQGDPSTLAISYFNNLGSPELAPLRKGLTALLIDDVAKARTFRVVERERMQALLDEMQLGTTASIDPRTAAKMGRLLGAGKIATGSYLDPSKSELRIDLLAEETANGRQLGVQQATGSLQNFIAVEKAIAMGMLKDLGQSEQQLQAAGTLAQIQAPQTKSLPAFAFFSRGLDAKDRLDYASAKLQLQEALRIDPDFEIARRELLHLPLGTSTVDAAEAVEAVAPSVVAAMNSTAGPLASVRWPWTTILPPPAGAPPPAVGAPPIGVLFPSIP
jgi:tetratricopeptide (TPR) repeat protein